MVLHWVKGTWVIIWQHYYLLLEAMLQILPVSKWWKPPPFTSLIICKITFFLASVLNHDGLEVKKKKDVTKDMTECGVSSLGILLKSIV